MGLFNNTDTKEFKVPMRINAKTDIRAQASATTDDTAFSSSFELLLLDNAITC
jgi:hypothetical protein